MSRKTKRNNTSQKTQKVGNKRATCKQGLIRIHKKLFYNKLMNTVGEITLFSNHPE